jgi:hypothetical protein
MTWTRDGVVTGCIRQGTITDVDNNVASGDFTVFLGNTIEDFVLFPCSGGLYIGGIVAEWLGSEAPLEDLTEGADRSPIRTDVIPGTHFVAAGAEIPVSIPPPPAGARFAVIKLAIAGDPGLTDASVDYVQFGIPSPTGPAVTVPVVSQLGLAALGVLILGLGMHASRARRRLRHG